MQSEKHKSSRSGWPWSRTRLSPDGVMNTMWRKADAPQFLACRGGCVLSTEPPRAQRQRGGKADGMNVPVQALERVWPGSKCNQGRPGSRHEMQMRLKRS